MHNNRMFSPTYRYRNAIFLLAVGKLDDELGAGSLLAVVQRPESTHHPDAILGGYFAFGRHSVYLLWLGAAI